MTVFRWIMLVLSGLGGTATVLAFAIYIGSGNDVWGERARLCRRWFYAFALLWFNIEIWRHVILIIVNW